jgi:hypothetical protein
VLGEFYWRVSTSDVVLLNDFVDPPYVLSEEKSGNEITWTVGEYIEPDVVQKAFSLKKSMPKRLGVAPNQPWPHEASYARVWQSFRWCTLIAILIQALSVMMADNRTIYTHFFEFAPGNSEAITTPVFEITGHTGNLHIINKTNLDNNWVALGMEIVDSDTGKVYAVNREVSYYRGQDSDGSWTEGSTSDDAEIAHVPPGRYVLSLDAESPANANANASAVTTQLQIRRNVSNWHNFFIAEAMLLLFPLIFWWRRASYIAKRWAGSDYGIKGSGEMIVTKVMDQED